MDERTSGRMNEKKKVLAGYFPCLLKLGGLVYLFYKCCSSNLSVMTKEDTVKV